MQSPLLQHFDCTPHLDQIAPALATVPRWTCYITKPLPEENRVTKPPTNTDGYPVNVHSPANWMPLQIAYEAVKRGKVAGIGFYPGNGIVALDFDNCRNRETGALTDWAMQFIMFLGGYWEISPSGTGLRGFFFWSGKPLTSDKIPYKGGKIEFHFGGGEGSYCTVTGRRLDFATSDLTDATSQIATLHQKLTAKQAEQTDTEGGTSAPKGTSPKARKVTSAAAFTDADLLHKARTNEKTGARFTALYDQGDRSLHKGDWSECDLELMGHLAYWTGKDAARMETLFSASALSQRAKWRDRADYRESTVTRAISGCRNVYDPNYRSSAHTGEAEQTAKSAPGETENRAKSAENEIEIGETFHQCSPREKYILAELAGFPVQFEDGLLRLQNGARRDRARAVIQKLLSLPREATIYARYLLGGVYAHLPDGYGDKAAWLEDNDFSEKQRDEIEKCRRVFLFFTLEQIHAAIRGGMYWSALCALTATLFTADDRERYVAQRASLKEIQAEKARRRIAQYGEPSLEEMSVTALLKKARGLMDEEEVNVEIKDFLCRMIRAEMKKRAFETEDETEEADEADAPASSPSSSVSDNRNSEPEREPDAPTKTPPAPPGSPAPPVKMCARCKTVPSRAPDHSPHWCAPCYALQQREDEAAFFREQRAKRREPAPGFATAGGAGP